MALQIKIIRAVFFRFVFSFPRMHSSVVIWSIVGSFPLLLSTNDIRHNYCDYDYLYLSFLELLVSFIKGWVTFGFIRHR